MIKKLITHCTPDLDALFSIYLIRTHGESLFEGIASAPVEFTSANSLPDGKSAQELENEGVLALDTGGGRFDNHPIPGKTNEEKWDTCAAKLVAEELGVADDPMYRYLLPFAVLQDTQGQSLYSRDAHHHLMTPQAVIDGLHRLYDDDTKVTEATSRYFEGLAESGKNGEPQFSEIAQIFDKALAAFIDSSYTEPSPFERHESPDWEIEGESHQIARINGHERKRDLEKLLRTASRLLQGSENALPDREEERRVLLPAALTGLANKYGLDSDEFISTASTLLDGLRKREADWFDALEVVKRSARVFRYRGVSFVAIANANGLVIKAARYRLKANGVLYFHPTSGAVTIQTSTRPNGKPYFDLQKVAVRMRTAESVLRKTNPQMSEIDAPGMVEGWFLHPSLQLLNCGSPKAPEVVPTKMDYPQLISMLKTELFPEEKIPEPWCPADDCLKKECRFYSLKLSNCFAHRKRLEESPKKGTLGDLFGDDLKSTLKNKKNK
ncbi:hypothetical protein K8I28_02805 [bacterium]|nr:hypothetical protein [bacterium]